MWSVTYIKQGKLEWREVPEPTIQSPDQAIVRPIAASRCDGDCAFIHYPLSHILKYGAAMHVLDSFGDGFVDAPFAVGHECVAEVVALGENVRHVTVGQRVIVPWSISCGYCQNCKNGFTSKCSTINTERLLSGYGFGRAMGGFGGMVSDLLLVPFADAMLIPTPDQIDPAVLAPASDNIPDAWRCVGPQLRQNPGAPVLVVGGGAQSIGLYAVGIAIALGSSRVDYIDTSDERLALAQSLGANAIKITKKEKWFKEGQPIHREKHPITVDAGNYEAGLNYAIRALAPGGQCTSVGFYFRKGTPVPLFQMYLNSSTLHIGVSHPRAVLADVLPLIEDGSFQPQKITTVKAAWDDAPEAFASRSVKVVVTR